MIIPETLAYTERVLMLILLTGAAGFLGSHLTDRLLAEGHRVIGLDNFVTGDRANLQHLEGNPNFRLIQQDVSGFIQVDEPLDYILHFASPASPNPASPLGYPNLPIQTLKAGALGTYNSLGLAKAHKARFCWLQPAKFTVTPLFTLKAKIIGEIAIRLDQDLCMTKPSVLRKP